MSTVIPRRPSLPTASLTVAGLFNTTKVAPAKTPIRVLDGLHGHPLQLPMTLQLPRTRIGLYRMIISEKRISNLLCFCASTVPRTTVAAVSKTGWHSLRGCITVRWSRTVSQLVDLAYYVSSIRRGRCSNGVCECEAGFSGVRCDFPEPCAKLSMDSRTAGFTGNRGWSTSYQRFVVDGNPVDTYYRPVYINQAEGNTFDLIFFTGRRVSVAALFNEPYVADSELLA
jgi:hypothetical protein